jgi:asparagine synthase (glutamine-hydrolysing)
MCGIVGHIAFSGVADAQHIQSMLQKMVHRGPDDHGIYTDTAAYPQAFLGQRRLSILDLSQAGRQPMCNEDGTVWIVFNGEIYNFQELRKDLSAKGHVFHSNTDTETILHLYEEHGQDCVTHLRGMFAFAIWDAKHRRLFLARDRVGKKPLYYARTHNGFFFASEIQALYAVPEIPRTLDWNALDLYFANFYIPSPYSIYREIRKLPPASVMVLDGEQCSISKYWALDYAPKLDISFEEAKERLLSLLEDATRIRLCSDVPLGCFLSGGVDSSTIVALMSRFSYGPVKTFSIGFPDKQFDETPYARAVAEYFQTEHHEFQVEPKSVDILPDLVRHYGEPYADSSALPTWYLSSLTREHVTVALNGDGGDESFAGYNWYQTGLWLDNVARYCPPALAAHLRRMVPQGLGTKARQARRLLELLAQEPAERFTSLRIQLKADIRTLLYAPEFRGQSQGTDQDYLVDLFSRCKGNDLLDRMLFTDAMSYLPEELLVKVDRATMAHSLEARSPFLDHQFMEFAAKLPSDFKLRNGRKKHILLEAVSPLFPQGFLERPKMGFSVPLQAWFQGELKPYVRERILHGKMAQSGYFNVSFLRMVLDGKAPQVRDTGSLIWQLLVLAEWMEQYA